MGITGVKFAEMSLIPGFKKGQPLSENSSHVREPRLLALNWMAAPTLITFPPAAAFCTPPAASRVARGVPSLLMVSNIITVLIRPDDLDR